MHFNAFFNSNRNEFNLLEASFCYPENRRFRFEKKVLIRDKDKLMDSMGNEFYFSWEEFIRLHQHILNNAGHVWEIYQEIMDQNL